MCIALERHVCLLQFIYAGSSHRLSFNKLTNKLQGIDFRYEIDVRNTRVLSFSFLRLFNYTPD